MSGNGLAYERRGAIAIVMIDDAPYNRMSFAFIDALESLASSVGYLSLEEMRRVDAALRIVLDL